MPAIINEIRPLRAPTICNFWWNASGPEITYTVSGDTYPYHHEQDGITRENDYRYKTPSTPIFAPILCDAIGATSPSNPKVITPPGVSIVQYLWNFGDGIEGYGPEPTHTYIVNSPDIMVSLTVVDSLGRRASCAKPINLAFLQFVAQVLYKIRAN